MTDLASRPLSRVLVGLGVVLAVAFTSLPGCVYRAPVTQGSAIVSPSTSSGYVRRNVRLHGFQVQESDSGQLIVSFDIQNHGGRPFTASVKVRFRDRSGRIVEETPFQPIPVEAKGAKAFEVVSVGTDHRNADVLLEEN